MTGTSIPGDAKSRMERILRLQEQVDAIKANIRDIYAEEKAAGGDKTAMGAAISYIRKREKDGAALAEREAMADVYVSAYDAPRAHTHTREARSYADAKLVETVAAGVQTETGRKALVAALDVMIEAEETADPETGEIIETQESGPTSEVRADDAIASDAGTLETVTYASAEHASDESSRTNTHSTVAAPPAAVEQPEAPNTSPATSGTNLTRPAFPAVSGDKPGIPSSAADGAKTDGEDIRDPGRADLASDHRCVKAEQVANPAPVIGHVSFATSSHINPDDMPEIPDFLKRDFQKELT